MNCSLCGRKRAAAVCPGCGRPKSEGDARLRAYVRRYWSADTDALALIDDFERAAAGQGCSGFGDALMSAFREFVGTYSVSGDSRVPTPSARIARAENMAE
jgi:hypothetical protein